MIKQEFFPPDKLFREVVRERRSTRAFLDKLVPEPLIRSVLEDAQLTSSNNNIQPWLVHIVSGNLRDRLSKVMCEAWDAQYFTPDFTFDPADYPEAYAGRVLNQRATYHQALGIAPDNFELLRSASEYNLRFFGSPQVAFLFMPAVGDNVRVAADVAMYAQTFLLSLVAHGLAGISQTMLGFFAEPIREVLGIPGHLKLLFGISFGYADEQSPPTSSA